MTPIYLKSKIIVICGPTAVGKTSFAIELASMFNGEIVGADSMQIYRHMDIGTAKPNQEEQARICHHMIDIIDPDQPFDAAQYAKMAFEHIQYLESQNLNRFIVGGTGLYIKSLLHGMFESKSSNSTVRNRLKAEASELGIKFLHERLKNCDPETAGQIHPKDTYRIIRAIEVYEITGKPISQHRKEHGFSDNIFQVLKIGLNIKREVLYQQIDKRAYEMVDAGFIKEVTNLLKMGYTPDLKSMKSIGYRHIVNHITKSIPLNETITTMQRDTRRYAKRQLTWFRADPEINWMEPKDLKHAHRLISKFMNVK